MQATLDGAAEVGFTVLSMSCSLIAVFIPILLMGGLVGRELREFATTLAVTVVLSLIVSLDDDPDALRPGPAPTTAPRAGPQHLRARLRVAQGFLRPHARPMRSATRVP